MTACADLVTQRRDAPPVGRRAGHAAVEDRDVVRPLRTPVVLDASGEWLAITDPDYVAKLNRWADAGQLDSSA
jgi:hypothetical protein